MLLGDNSNDVIFGGAGIDFVIGGSGWDQLTGGADSDRFVWDALNWGQDHVTDWEDNLDKLDFRGSGLLFGDLTLSANGGNAKIEHIAAGQTNVIILDGIAVADITATDFIFV